MEKKKKRMSPILIVILSMIGIFLLGFIIWYGIEYFNGDENKLSIPDNQASKQEESVKKEIGKKLEISTYLNPDYKKIIDNILHESNVICDKVVDENGVLTVKYYDDTKYKFSGITGEVKCAYIASSEGGDMTAYILSKSGDLYVAEFSFDEALDTQKLTKVAENMSSMVIKDQGVMDETIPIIITYILDDSGNYYRYNYDYDNKKYNIEKVKKPDEYYVNIVEFDSNSISKNKLIYKDIEVVYIFFGYPTEEGYDLRYSTYIIGKDNYLYGAKLEDNSSDVKIEKVTNQKIKKFDLKSKEDGEYIVSMEFE